MIEIKLFYYFILWKKWDKIIVRNNVIGIVLFKIQDAVKLNKRLTISCELIKIEIVVEKLRIYFGNCILFSMIKIYAITIYSNYKLLII